jgi:hypothetical protein
MTINIYIPPWLLPLMAERELLIVSDPKPTCCNLVDPNDFDCKEFLPPHQLHVLDSKSNYFTIDSKRKMIIG